MNHRIFIAINLPISIKEKLASYASQWKDLPIGWTKETNLHITLLFIGNANEEKIFEYKKALSEIAKRHRPFALDLKKITLGPPGKPPKMVWVEISTPDELLKLRADLIKTLSGIETNYFARSSFGRFSPHITLGRIRESSWRKFDINENLDLCIEVSSVELMESDLKKDGAEYTVLQKSSLGSILAYGTTI